MILFLGSGAGVLAASTAATAAVWPLATPWRRKIARTAVTQICIISASEISCEKYDPQAVATAAKAAHIVLLLNIIISLSFCGTLKSLVSLNQKLLHPILSLKPSLPHEVKSLHPIPFLTFRSPARHGYGEQPACAFFGPTGSTSCLL
jgi:hypothetical protein